MKKEFDRIMLLNYILTMDVMTEAQIGIEELDQNTATSGSQGVTRGPRAFAFAEYDEWDMFTGRWMVDPGPGRGACFSAVDEADARRQADELNGDVLPM